MSSISIDRVLRAPIGPVFDVMSDHARYDRFRGVTSAALTREGADEPNGLGAIRVIEARPLRFEEEITAFERPHRFDYLILSTNVPLDHDGGSIRFEEVPEGTRVTWTSTFTSTVPVVTGPTGGLMAAMLRRAFNRMLDDTERLAAAQPAAT